MKAFYTYFKVILYGLSYAVVITLLTLLFDQSNLFLKIENSIYDPLQNWWVIDYAEDWRLDGFQDILDRLYCIQLDDGIIEFENNRIKRDQLAELLQKLKGEENVAAIFLDYIFEPLDTNDQGWFIGKDSLLYESMAALGSKLFFLRGDGKKNVFDENTWMTENFQSFPAAQRPQTASIQLQSLQGEETVRYIDMANEQASFPESLIRQLGEQDLIKQLENTPKNIELNYWLRDIYMGRIPPVINGDNASDIIHRGLLPRDFQAIEQKIIFIGAFNPLFNKYNLPFDSFETPVSKQHSGIYINLNSFLNIATQSYIQRASWLLIFLTNFLIAILGAIYFHQLERKIQRTFIKPKAWWISELLLIIILISLFIGGLFYWQYIKYPFVFTLLFLVRNHFLYKNYTQLSKIKNT